jgi:predicted nucleic acid-binding protein
MIVADAGPIIAFACVGRLALLQQAVGALIVLNAVYEEPVVQGGDGPRAEEVRSGGRMQRYTL